MSHVPALIRRAAEWALQIYEAVRSGRTTPEEVDAKIADLRARPPRSVNLTEMERALEERRRLRQEEDTAEFPVVERFEPEPGSER